MGESSERKRAEQADGAADHRHAPDLREHERAQFLRLRPERETQPELAFALRDVESEHGVEPDGCEQRREPRERRGQERHEAIEKRAVVHVTAERRQIAHGHVRIDALHHLRNRRLERLGI